MQFALQIAQLRVTRTSTTRFTYYTRIDILSRV